MGVYNPHAPGVLGQEWVPIIDQPYVPSYDEEIGHTFPLHTSNTVITGRVYTNTPIQSRLARFYPLISVYPQGVENEWGPVKQTTIYCSGGALTGGAALSNASSIQAAMRDPSDLSSIAFNSTGQSARLNFDVVAHTELSGKRIIRVEVLHSASLQIVSGLQMGYDCNGASQYGAHYITGRLSGSSDPEEAIDVEDIGELTPFWGTQTTKTSLGFDGLGASDYFPWDFSSLSRFDLSTTAAQRLFLVFSTLNSFTSVTTLDFCALRITYCEEKRLAYGSREWGAFQDVITVPIRTTALASGVTLPPGPYTVTFKFGDQGVNNATFGQVRMNALRGLYDLTTHNELIIPRATIVDKTSNPTDTVRHVQISLHTAAGSVTGTHSYGRQVTAPVYSGVVARQHVVASSAGTQSLYPQTRFYARRFGKTQMPLVIRDRNVNAINASIDPVTFDALPELANGWREVNLRFSSPTPSFAGSGGTNEYEWFSTESSGNRWEVLAARAPAVSGMGGPTGEISDASSLVATTYGGSTASMFHDAVQDLRTDATLMLAQDMPTVSGFALSTASQILTGIALDCTTSPNSIATGIGYVNLAWNALNGVWTDTFNRNVVSGWGTADAGEVYTLSGGTNNDYNVTNGSSGVGTITLQSANVSRKATVGTPAVDVDIVGVISTNQLATGAALEGGFVARFIDTSNYYRAVLSFGTNQIITLSIIKLVAATPTTVFSTALTNIAHAVNQRYRLRFAITGTAIYARAWADGLDEPTAWHVITSDSSLTTTGQVGAYALANAGSTNVNAVVSFDNVCAEPYGFGYYELQRRDAYETQWCTIMKASRAGLLTFNDYEARVGVQSWYQIRSVHELGFTGPWVSGSATVSSPGFSGQDAFEGGALIFTSNARQNGSGNLAYIMTWDGDVDETLTFPESGTAVFQRMFGRDFQTYFHPLERGGVRFTRAILVQRAAVSPAALQAGLKSLRDLAWATLPYVCVRTESGDRWLAAVAVPSGSVRSSRTLQFAQVEVTEITGTPYPVDPPG